jgi:hypothetical protein
MIFSNPFPCRYALSVINPSRRIRFVQIAAITREGKLSRSKRLLKSGVLSIS